MSASPIKQPLGWSVRLGSAVASGLAFFALDLLWLGVVAQPVYAKHLGPLKAESVVWPAAILFYLMYITAIQMHAIWPVQTGRESLKRGASMGFFAYATYELTNWAVIQDWPSEIVLIDIAWGVILTGLCALAGFKVKSLLLTRNGS